MRGLIYGAGTLAVRGFGGTSNTRRWPLRPIRTPSQFRMPTLPSCCGGRAKLPPGPGAWPESISHQKNKTAVALATIAAILITIVILLIRKFSLCLEDFALPRVPATPGLSRPSFYYWYCRLIGGRYGVRTIIVHRTAPRRDGTRRLQICLVQIAGGAGRNGVPQPTNTRGRKG